MIEFNRLQDEFPGTNGLSICVVGLGGAGSNVLDRIALEGMQEAELICANTDIRALSNSVANTKVQLGKKLTQGLGCGGDPELGLEAAQASEDELRKLLRGRVMVFVCVGLGGGTGSGAAPLIAKIAREEGAFVVGFATMPFSFEGRRRLRQAEASLEELQEVCNALVTFENDRMGSLVLPKEGIQQAFAGADKLISQSVRSVTSLVSQPGLIRIGMDDLITALRNRDSRCLFGYGQAKGENRAQEALAQALKSPLLDKGALLEDARNVLVHICGGESMTLFEVEHLMNELTKHVPDSAQILFGASSDAKMGANLSVTIITSLGIAPAAEPDFEIGGEDESAEADLPEAEEGSDFDAEATEEDAAVAEEAEAEVVAEIEEEEEVVAEVIEEEEIEPAAAAEADESAEAEDEAPQAKESKKRRAPKLKTKGAKAKGAAAAAAAAATADVVAETTEFDLEGADLEAAADLEVAEEVASEESVVAEITETEEEEDFGWQEGEPDDIAAEIEEEVIAEADADPEEENEEEVVAEDEESEDVIAEVEEEEWEDEEEGETITAETADDEIEANDEIAAEAAAEEDEEEIWEEVLAYTASEPAAESPFSVSGEVEKEEETRAEAEADEVEAIDEEIAAEWEEEEEVVAETPAAEFDPDPEPVAEQSDPEPVAAEPEPRKRTVLPPPRRETPKPKPAAARADQDDDGGYVSPYSRPEFIGSAEEDAAADLEPVGAGARAGVAEARQEMLQLEPLSRGRFDKSERTIIDGEDLDVPTFLRRKR